MGIAKRFAASLLVTWLAATTSCEIRPRCGNAVIDEDETCDDGNQLGGDGCSASCEPDDDSRTPGDDRPGYFICSTFGAEPITCGPGSVCCMTEGPRCASADPGCVDRFTVASCDGPEDCPADSHCETMTHGIACTGAEVSGTWCHTDDDCTAPPSPWLLPGPCSAAGLCQFGVIPPERVEL